MARKQSQEYQPPLTHRESLLIRLIGMADVFCIIMMYLAAMSALTERVVSIITSALSSLLVLGLMFIPELREVPEKKALQGLPYMTITAFFLSGLLLMIAPAMYTLIPDHLLYIKIALLILLIVFFWIRSEAYRHSFLRFIALTAALAMFSFSIPEALNCALDVSVPTEVQATIVDMKVTSPSRPGRGVYYSVAAEIDGSTIGIAMSSHDFGRYTEGDPITLQKHKGAFGMPYYEYVPG